jgi:hypothetical protein
MRRSSPLSDHDLAGVDAHAHGEVDSLRQTKLVRVAAQILLQRQGCVAGAGGVVLVGDGGAEKGHDPIARVLIDRPLEAVNSVG